MESEVINADTAAYPWAGTDRSRLISLRLGMEVQGYIREMLCGHCFPGEGEWWDMAWGEIARWIVEDSGVLVSGTTVARWHHDWCHG